MKVRDLMNKAHLYGYQKIKVQDVGTQRAFVTVDRYNFDLTKEEADRVLKLKVNSFACADDGLTIWAGKEG